LVKNADLFIFESCLGLFFSKKIKNKNTKAKIIYRVSDDLRLLKYHPDLYKYEKILSSYADLISVPCKFMLTKFQEHDQKIRLQYHGIDKALFDRNYKNPYQSSGNLVFVGISHLDYEFLEIASKHYSNYYFHVIGPFAKKIKRENVIFYGYMPFIDTIPYIKYADAALQIRCNTPYVETLADSLKYQQYTYSRLPIISPIPMKSNKPHVFYYKYGDVNSICSVYC
jgi:2-beta-glucuronyltransferase